MKIKKTYRFAFKSSFYLAIFSFLALYFLSKLITQQTNLLFLVAASILVFLFSFIIVQFRVEKFIYKRVKKIYDEVSLLDVQDLGRNKITSDMETLSKEVKKFAEDKRLEIEMLQIREEYRREFLGNVAHELKTPLFTVQGYLLTLADGAIDDKTIRDKYLKRANKGVDRLINIVTDLDMISKLESGNLNLKFEKFDIIRLVQSVFELLEIKAKRKNIYLGYSKLYDTPILVRADRKRIEQVLINLIENSIKYGKQGGKTIVSVQNHSPGQFIVKIIDDGEGIKEIHIPRLFERFYRVDQSRSREQGGSGLGLSIVKHIMEAHYQQVFVESEFGKGSTFSFTIEKVE